MMVGHSGQRRARQQAQAHGDVTQVAGDMHVHPAPVRATSVQWPVWVGDVPRTAAAFQPRTWVRERVKAARGGGSDVVLSGPGGVGKSQLAASLARDLRDQERSDEAGLDLLVWVRATGTDQVISAFAEAAGRLQLSSKSSGDEEESARLFLRWLAAAEQRWLVVLDDVTDLPGVRQWWPDSGAGRGWVLATSRREDAQLSGEGRALIRLGLYTNSEARAYLKRRLTDAGHAHLYNPEQAGELATELGHLPLALGHAAAYLINKRRTMANYLTLLRDTSSQLRDLLPASGDTEGYGRSVTASLLLSLYAAEEADGSGLARPLLHLASLMHPLGHPATVWTTPEALDHLRTVRPPQRRWLRKHHPPVTETEVHNALEHLRTYTLIFQDTATAPLRVHALTARAVRETIPPGRLPAMARTAADALTSIWPRYNHEGWELAALLRANAVHLDQLTRPALWQPTTHPCIHTVSNSLTEAGLYHEAIEYNETVLRLNSSTHGPDHRSTLGASHNLAASYMAAGKIQDALDLCERALAHFERVSGPDHPDTLSARNNLANSYSAAGRIQDALDLRERVLSDYERVLGPDHPDTLSARNNLAISYSAAGRIQDALDLRERVLPDYERVLGSNHPDTLTARNNLANSYSDAGRIQDAVDLGERALADRERVLGPDHPNTIDVRNNLANFYSRSGRIQDALYLHERVLFDYERVLGPDHPNTIDARNNLANSYSRSGRIQDAVDLGERALADRERVLGPDHPNTARARHNLAVSYIGAGRSQDALYLLERVLSDLERLLGSDHPDTLTARHNLASTRQTAAAEEQPDIATAASTADHPPNSATSEQPK